MKIRKQSILLWIFLVFMLIQFMSIQAFASDFNVTIPKTIVLDNNKQSSYSVKVDGEIADNETINVQPVKHTFLMKDLTEKNPKADVTASIKSTKTEWNSTDVLNSVVSDDNGVSAQELSAGSWKGTFEFQISINKTLKLETDGDVTIEVGTTLQTNAYLNDEIVNNIVSWVSNNENIVIENGLVSTSENATSGEEANVTVTYIDTATGKQLQATFKVTVVGSKYGNVVARTGYCGADESYEAVSFKYPTTIIANSGGLVNDGQSDICYTNAKYTYYSDTKTLVISGVGDIKAKGASVYSGTYGDYKNYQFTLPRTGYGSLYKEVEHVVVEDGITGLDFCSFEHFNKLKDIYLGNTLETINSRAFCETEVLEELVIPDSVKTIGSSILANSGVKKVTVGKGLESFSSACFSNMHYCEEVRYNAIDAKMDATQNEGVYECFYYIGDKSENGTIFYIGEDVENIPDNFTYKTMGSESLGDIKRNKSKIKSIIFEGENLKSIGANAFDNCISIVSIDLPDSLEIIGDQAFSGCANLSAVDLGTNLKQICSRAFASTSITEIRLPDNLTTIDSYAFSYCPLSSMYIPKSVNIINTDGEQSGAPFYKCNFDRIYCGADEKQQGWETYWNLCYNNSGDVKYYEVLYGITRDEYEYYTAKEIRIPNTITTITQEEIQKYPNMETVYIPSSVTSIGNDAFYGCTNLRNIIFEDGSQLETIGERAFRDCTSLESIEIPDNVTSIGNYAFNGCSSLQEVVFGEASQLEIISDNMFENCTNLIEIKVPDSVTSIGNNAFKGCSNLKMVYIPLSVKTIAATTYTKAPFYGVSTAKIYCAADKKQSGWGTYWNYYTSSNKLTTFFSASKDEYDEFSAKNIVLSNTLTSVTQQEIQKYPNMETVYIPNTVTSIETQAFDGCTNLTTVMFEEGSQLETIGNAAFYNCTNLTDIEISNSVISIGNQAFSQCSNLTSIEIPDSVTSIGNNAFYGCSNLKNIIFEDGSQLETIGEGAFKNCTSLESIEIPDSVISIGNYAFYGCTNLKNVIFENENQLKTIGTSVFQNCTSLEGIEIPDSVTSIGNSAFSGCSSLIRLTIPVSTTFTSSSFTKCTNITNVHLTQGTGIMTAYTSTTYAYTPWYISRNSMEDILIENGVTNIGDYSFYNSASLTKIIIPDSVISIGNYAFRGCTNLADITIEEGSRLETIGTGVFYTCTSLESIELPNSVTSIGNNAFRGCTSLTTIYIPSSVTTIAATSYSNSPFYQCSSTLQIYCGAGEEADGWGTYWNYYASGKTLPTTFGVVREEYENLLISETSLLCEDEMVENMDNILMEIEDVSETTVEAENEEKLTDIETASEELETNESAEGVEMRESTKNSEDVETLEEMFLQENDTVVESEDIENDLTNTESNN